MRNLHKKEIHYRRCKAALFNVTKKTGYEQFFESDLQNVSASGQCLDRQIEYSLKGSLAERSMLLSHDFNTNFAIRRNIKCFFKILGFGFFPARFQGELTLHKHTKNNKPVGDKKYLHAQEKLVDECVFARGREIILVYCADVYIIDIWRKKKPGFLCIKRPPEQQVRSSI